MVFSFVKRFMIYEVERIQYVNLLQYVYVVTENHNNIHVTKTISNEESYSDKDKDLFLFSVSSCGNGSNTHKNGGFRNSFPVFQRVHIEKVERGERIDYFEILKYDLRNMRPLTKEKFEYIKNLKTYQMYEIIEIYSDVTKLLMQISDLPQDD